MVAHIHACPAEVIGTIAQYLDIAEVRTLRCISRDICSKVSQSVPFRGLFKHHRCTIDEEGLRTLKDFAHDAKYSSAVADVTLIMPLYDERHVQEILRSKRDWVDKPPRPFSMTAHSNLWHDCTTEEVMKAEKDVSWLHTQMLSAEKLFESGKAAELLANAFRGFRRLRSITLEAAVYQGEGRKEGLWAQKPWHHVWLATAQGYKLLHSALRSSEVVVEALHVFTTIDSCSVMLPVVAETLEHGQLHDVTFRSLKRLGLSCSSRLPVEQLNNEIGKAKSDYLQRRLKALLELTAPPAGHPVAAKDDGGSAVLAAPARILQLMPYLEELDLHYCRFSMGGRQPHREEILRQIANIAVFPALRKCKLRGLTTTQADMLRLLQRLERLEYLTLRSIWLASGQWQPIVRHFWDMVRIEEVTLSALRSGVDGQFNLAIRGKPMPEELNPHDYSYPCTGGTMVHTRTLSRSDLQDGLAFDDRDIGRAMGSPMCNKFWGDLRREFENVC